MIDSSVQCGKCGISLDESGNETYEQRKPCPQCGFTGRSLGIKITDTVTIHESVGLKAKRPGEKKPYVEQKTGDSYGRKLEKWLKHERTIDRDNDHYVEKVVDPTTGETIHAVSEPLSKHVGHGSDKLKKIGSGK